MNVYNNGIARSVRMKVTGTSVNNIVNIYDKNKCHIEKNKEVTNKKDYIEISQLGKSLSAFGNGEITGISAEKIEQIKMEISNGTYNVDAKLVAEKIIDVMKGRKV
jgi:Negative regulator of flagellin synthesis (anti-sigma28 factor)